MSRASIIRRGCVVVLCAIAGGGAARARAEGAGKADVVTFHLAIPDQLALVETRRVEKRIELGDGSEPEVTREPPAETKVVYRRTPKGFVVEAGLAAIPPNAAPTENSPAAALATALSGVKLQLEFDTEGTLLKLRGLNTITEELRTILPPELVPLFEAMLGPAIDQWKDGWVSRFGQLVGKSFEVGSVRSAPTTISIRGAAPVPATLSVSMKSRTTCAGRPCVRFGMGYMIDDPAIEGELMGLIQTAVVPFAKRAGLSTKKVKSELGKLPEIRVKRMETTVDRLVDPATMIVYEETMVRRFRFEVEGAMNGSWSETTSIRYAPSH